MPGAINSQLLNGLEDSVGLPENGLKL